MFRPARSLLLPAILSLVSCGGNGGNDAEDARPNVLLVSFDTTRADALGCYGSTAGATPNIDRLAAGGVRFDAAFAPTPITLPSHTTMLTGLDPPRHRVRDNAIYEVPGEAVTLAELLAQDGYRTFAVISTVVLLPQFGLNQGFQEYETGALRLAAGTATERPADEVATSAIDLVDGSAPFFGFVHFYDPHQPYRPPADLAGRFASDPYLGEVAAADRALGRILDHLRKEGTLDDTLVIVTGDHGEGLGEHGERTHTLLLHDATQRVPLILAHPSLGAAVVEDRIASLADVTPTTLDFLGRPVPARLDGRSLLPVLSGEDPAEGAAYLETLSPQLAYDWAPLFGVRTPEWKLVIGARPHLYRVSQDPRELVECAAEHPDVVAALERQIVHMRDGRGPSLGARPRQVTGQERAILGGIGYVAGASEDPDFDATGLPDPHDHVEAAFQLSAAKFAFSTRNYPEAIRILEALARELPGTFLMRQSLGSAYAMADRPQDALAEFLAAVQLHDESVDIHLQIANVAARCARPDLVRVHLEQATAKDGCPPSAFLDLARNLHTSGEGERAKTVLRGLVQREARSRWTPQVYQQLAQAFTDLGAKQDANDVVRRMLGRDHIRASIKQQARGTGGPGGG